MMKPLPRTMSCVLMAGLVCASVLAPVASSTVYAAPTGGIPTENGLVEIQRGPVLKNPDFEKDGAWNLLSAEIVSDEHSDGRAARINPNEHPFANAHIWQSVALKKNTDYTLSAKVKIISESPETKAYLVVKTGSINNPSGFRQQAVTAGTAEWQDVSISFNSGENASFVIGLDRWIEGATGQDKASKIYLDNVSLTGAGDAEPEPPYEIIWADEFNGNALDESKWGYELGRIRGVEQQHYVKDPENVYVSDGHLTLQITNRNPEDQYDHPRGPRRVIYDSGSIRTHGKQEFMYGRIEMRAKLPKGKGVFPAFWTLGADFGLDGRINREQMQPWPVCGEVDIMELTGKASDSAPGGNQTVWQTLHYGPAFDQNTGKYAGNGTSYSLPEGIFNDEYHIFGLNWSKGKMEWYVDNQIVRTVDYSDDPLALTTLDRPQYIQLNLAAGGNWPGDAGLDLAGQKMEVDYVYYAQNEQQKRDAAEYYANAATIEGVKDVVMTQGDVPDLLEGVVSTKNTVLDFSVEDEHMFVNKGKEDVSRVKLVCTGKDDAQALASLPAGKYNIHYTAKEAQNNGLKPMVRRSAILTVQERTLESDLQASGLTLAGYENDPLSTITLPDGWAWQEPSALIQKTQARQKMLGTAPVVFEKNGFQTKGVATFEVKASTTAEQLQGRLTQAEQLAAKTQEYTAESIAQLNGAIQQARAVLQQTNATFAQITQAYEQLQAAIAGLQAAAPTPPVEQPAPPAPEQPVPPAQPVPPPTPPASQPVTVPSGSTAPQTGDAFSVGAWGLLSLVSIGSFAYIKRSARKKEN